VKQLAVYGGRNAKETVNKLLRVTLTNSLAEQYNWSGKKGKRPFGVLKLVNVIHSKQDFYQNEIFIYPTSKQHLFPLNSHGMMFIAKQKINITIVFKPSFKKLYVRCNTNHIFFLWVESKVFFLVLIFLFILFIH
jgi:hypothetical protein